MTKKEQREQLKEGKLGLKREKEKGEGEKGKWENSREGTGGARMYCNTGLPFPRESCLSPKEITERATAPTSRKRRAVKDFLVDLCGADATGLFT